MPPWIQRALLAALIVSASGCSAIVNAVVLYPSHQEIESPLGREIIEVEVDGDPLRLEIFGAVMNAPGLDGDVELLVLSFGGNASRAEFAPFRATGTLAPVHSALAPARYQIVALQYPGYGKSEGDADLETLVASAEQTYRLMRAKTDLPILIHGFSLGTVAALHVARSVDGDPRLGLLLEKPPNLRSMVLDYGWWNLWLLAGPLSLGVPSSACSDANAEAITHTPAVIIEGLRDGTVPAEFVREVHAAYAGPKRLLSSDTSHNGDVKPSNTAHLRRELEWLLEEIGVPLYPQ